MQQVHSLLVRRLGEKSPSYLLEFFRTLMTLFEKIIHRHIPATIVAESQEWIAFEDVNPQAPIHLLIVPKRVIPRIAEVTISDQDLLGSLLLAAQQVAKKLNLEQGFRIVINNGLDGGETVPHLHLHLLAGRPLSWPPG
jgi:histidine triad (HIT) family protein